MATRSGTKNVSVRLEGLEELRKIPGLLERGERRLLDRSSEKIGESIAERAPGGGSGSIGEKVRARTLSSTSAEIVVDHPGARAQERGAFVAAKPGGVLRFRNGTFSRFARIPATRFATRGLRPRRKIIMAEYGRVFADLNRTTP